MQTVLHACTLHTVSYGVQNTYKWYHPTHMVGIRKIGLSHYTKQEFSSSKQETQNRQRRKKTEKTEVRFPHKYYQHQKDSDHIRREWVGWYLEFSCLTYNDFISNGRLQSKQNTSYFIYEQEFVLSDARACDGNIYLALSHYDMYNIHTIL